MLLYTASAPATASSLPSRPGETTTFPVPAVNGQMLTKAVVTPDGSDVLLFRNYSYYGPNVASIESLARKFVRSFTAWPSGLASGERATFLVGACVVTRDNNTVFFTIANGLLYNTCSLNLALAGAQPAVLNSNGYSEIAPGFGVTDLSECLKLRNSAPYSVAYKTYNQSAGNPTGAAVSGNFAYYSDNGSPLGYGVRCCNGKTTVDSRVPKSRPLAGCGTGEWLAVRADTARLYLYNLAPGTGLYAGEAALPSWLSAENPAYAAGSADGTTLVVAYPGAQVAKDGVTLPAAGLVVVLTRKAGVWSVAEQYSGSVANEMLGLTLSASEDCSLLALTTRTYDKVVMIRR